jgi:predicted nuclease of predicted toxin-antitoxin system
MRFLLDHNISPKVAGPLRAAGHDVAVAREVGMSRATDEAVIDFARRQPQPCLGPPALVAHRH